MCDFFSCILKKSGEVLSVPFSNSHEDIITEYQLDDSLSVRSGVRDWMRVEIRPPGGNVFDNHIKDWRIVIDELSTEEWYLRNKVKLDKELKRILRLEHKAVVVTNRAVDTICNKRIFVGHNGIVKNVRGNGIVESVRDNGIVGDVWDNGIVKNVWDNGIVKYVLDNGIVKNVWDNGIVESVRGNGIVESVRDNGIVKDVRDNGIVKIHNKCSPTVLEKAIVIMGNRIIVRKGGYSIEEESK